MRRSIRASFVTHFILASLLLAAPVLAVDIVVTTGVDAINEDAQCSLREAVIAANTDAPVGACPAGSGADRVLVSRNGYYPLNRVGAGEDAALTGDLDVVGELDIVAVGPSGGRGRIWQEDEDRAIHVIRSESAVSRLRLVDIALLDGWRTPEVPYGRCGYEVDGGCIYVDPYSHLELVHSEVNSGRAAERGGNVFLGEGATADFDDSDVILGVVEGSSGTGQGAGIFADSGASVTIHGHGGVSYNYAGIEGPGEGGGIYLSAGSDLYAERTDFHSNRVGLDSDGEGGGLFLAPESDAVLERVDITENHATHHGGGMYVSEDATVKSNYVNLLGNVVDGETASYGGGIYNLGDVHMARADISENQALGETENGRGAGVYNQAIFTADESLIANNWASRLGGGVVSTGVTTLITTTLSGNVANDGNGGGFWSTHQTPEGEDPCELEVGDVFIQVTVAENIASGSGPGLNFQGGADACLINSVVADGCHFVGSTAAAYAAGQNAEQVSAGCGLGGLFLTDAEMDLGPLADNGGSTWTHLPGGGSLLIDEAENGFCPALDQRWAFRPTHFLGEPGDICDVGAVEADGRRITAVLDTSCGLGFEFALLLPVLTWWQRRRARV